MAKRNIYARLDEMVENGSLSKTSAGAYKANLTRQFANLEADTSVNPKSIPALKAAMSRRVLQKVS